MATASGAETPSGSVDPGLADRGEQVVARLLAAAAKLRADAAMVMVGRVALALIAARTTRRDTCFDRGPDDAEVGFGLAGHDAADGVADIGAVETAPDAPHHLGHVRLAEAGVGARRTRGGTVEALVNTAEQQVAIKADGPRMPLDDFCNRHGLSFASGLPEPVCSGFD